MQSTRSESSAAMRRLRVRWASALCLSLVLSMASVHLAAADDYDATRAGHPLRILAYVLHPVGVVLDYLVMRPAHWIASQEPISTLVGHED